MSANPSQFPTPAPGRKGRIVTATLPLWRSFAFRLSLMIAAAFLATIVAAGWYAYHSNLASQMHAFEQRLHGLALSLSKMSDGDAITRILRDPNPDSVDFIELKRRLRAISAQVADIESLYIMTPTSETGRLAFLCDISKKSRVAPRGELYDASGVPGMLQGLSHVFVEDRPYADGFGSTQSAYAPILDSNDQVVALIGVDVLSVDVEAIQSRVLHFCVLLFSCLLAVLLLIAYWVHRRVSLPLSAVSEAAAKVVRGGVEFGLDLQRQDEFGVLARDLKAMSEELRDRELLKQTFGLHISRDLAELILKEGGASSMEASECPGTVLVIDIRHFTRISGALKPAETIAMLNDYLAAAAEVIRANRGCALDFQGDTIITVFGAPFYRSEHAVDAMKCAMDLLNRLETLNEVWVGRGYARLWRQAGLGPVELKMGLHTGRLLTGNLGAPGRLKFCVLGETVKIAADLESVNKDQGSTILMSEAVKIRLPIELSASFGYRGEMAVLEGRVRVPVFALGGQARGFERDAAA